MGNTVNIDLQILIDLMTQTLQLNARVHANSIMIFTLMRQVYPDVTEDQFKKIYDESIQEAKNELKEKHIWCTSLEAVKNNL